MKIIKNYKVIKEYGNFYRYLLDLFLFNCPECGKEVEQFGKDYTGWKYFYKCKKCKSKFVYIPSDTRQRKPSLEKIEILNIITNSINKIKKRFDFLIIHFFDVGRLNGNLIFSIFNIYHEAMLAPWVLVGIGYEKHLTKEIPRPGHIYGYIILYYIGRQKRIEIKKK